MSDSPEYSLLNLYHMIGSAGQLSIACFVATLVIALVIQVRRLGMRFRAVLGPLSFLPLVLGIYGCSSGAIQSIEGVRAASVHEPFQGVLHFSEVLLVLKLTAAETAILLVVAAVVMILSPVQNCQTKN